jgi:hypothetical protein
MEMTPYAYHVAREELAHDLRVGVVGQSPEAIFEHVRASAGVPASTAAWFTERFFADLRRHLKRNQNILT